MTATSLTDTQGIIAIAAAALAVMALLGCAALALSVRRLRAAQKVVLGEGERDVVAHAAAIQGGFEDLREYVGEVAERLEQRLGGVELGLRGAISHRALVRYDAYNELSGHQSVSIALLDGTALGGGAHLHPPPRPGARVPQAGAGGQRRTGALPGGGRGGAAGALPGGQRRTLRRAAA